MVKLESCADVGVECVLKLRCSLCPFCLLSCAVLCCILSSLLLSFPSDSSYCPALSVFFALRPGPIPGKATPWAEFEIPSRMQRCTVTGTWEWDRVAGLCWSSLGLLHKSSSSAALFFSFVSLFCTFSVFSVALAPLSSSSLLVLQCHRSGRVDQGAH